MKRLRRYQQIKKIASKVGAKGAKGMNFDHAQNQLSESNPGMEFSRDEITRKISEEPLFSEEALDSIFKIEIEPHHAKMMNKAEKAFVEIGAFLTQKEDHIQEIGDYLRLERAKPGWIGERYNISLQTLQSVVDEFTKLDQAQREAHEEAARKDAERSEKEGLFGNGYMTNEVVYEFGDGWKVVYVPAVGEGPSYKGYGRKSNDRTIEGNLNGLCLGATMGYYQDNRRGKIYSVRDPNNNPKVTIRLDSDTLHEAKGKNNLPPDVPGAIHAKEWLLKQNINLDSMDYKNFPPTTKEEVIKFFSKDTKTRHGSPYRKGWVMHWYRMGIPELDSDVEEKIKNNDILIMQSGMGKKYKELAEPVVKHWAEAWTEREDSSIWANFSPNPNLYELSHESWKVYKKQPWMKSAVEKLMEKRKRFGFKIGIHKISEYYDFGEKAAKSLAEESPESFFRHKLDEVYKDIGRYAAETIVEGKSWPDLFFNLKLNERPEYKDLTDKIIKDLAKNDPGKFFSSQIFYIRRINKDIFSKYEKIAAENLAHKNPEDFFQQGLEYNYKEFGRKAARKIAITDPEKFFLLDIKKKLGEEVYLDIGKTAAKNIGKKVDDLDLFFGQRFRDYNLYLDFPEEAKEIAENILKSDDFTVFFDLNLHKLNDYFKEMGREYAELILAENRNNFFKKRLHITYPEMSRSAAEDLANENVVLFFYSNADEIYDKSLVAKIEKLINQQPIVFFDAYLWLYYTPDSEKYRGEDGPEKIKIYEELGIKAAKKIIEIDPHSFFASDVYRMLKTDPSENQKLAFEAANAIIELEPDEVQDTYDEFFGPTHSLRYYGKYLADAFPDLAEKVILNLWNKSQERRYIKHRLTKPFSGASGLKFKYPYMAISSPEIAANIWPHLVDEDRDIISFAALQLDPESFTKIFLLNSQSVDYLNENFELLLYSWINQRQREKIFKNISESTMYRLFRKMEAYNILDLNLFPDEFIEKLPELTAKYDPEKFNFFYPEEDNKELAEKALRNLADKNFIKWLKLSKILQYILPKLKKNAVEEIERLSDVHLKLGNASEGIAYVEEFLDDNYLLLIKEVKEDYIKRVYYNNMKENEWLEKTRKIEEHVAASEFIEHRTEDAVKGLCAGIFVSLLRIKNILQKDIENKILNEATKKDGFIKFYKIGYNYVNEKTGIYEPTAAGGKEYLHETEGIYEENENFYEDEYNPFKELFYREKTREEVEEELGEELEDDPDLINEYEFEDEAFDKFSKLYEYLVSSGFLKEAEALEGMTKLSVLKRLKRTTRGKGKRDRMEWALVSKSNPKKILKWFGPDKPSKKEVAKEERRVHAFG